MESKRDKAVRLLKDNNDFLLCPVCREKLSTINDYALSCVNGHSFDISKKGSLNLAGSGNDKVYDDVLFRHRRSIIDKGYYAPLIKILSGFINEYQMTAHHGLSILDAGCGEGSFLNSVYSDMLLKNGQGKYAGIDLSKSGISLATDHQNDILWLIDDLSKIHIADGKFDMILNILSPANYSEFKRVLKKDGIIIKVIPGKNYLKEIRDLYIEDSKEKQYDNTETIKYTEGGMAIFKRSKLEYTVSPDIKEFSAFSKMTPMTHGKIDNQPLENKKAYGLTIDLEIIFGNPL